MRLAFQDFANNLSVAFQDPATNVMYGIIDLHDTIIFYLILFLVLVFWVFISTFGNRDHLYTLTEDNTLEILWTLTPATILWCIALPSLQLLYLIDEILEPDLTIKAIGHSWYWSYEYSDFSTALTVDSFLIPDTDLTIGEPRQLTVDNYLVLPTLTNIRILITSVDVIHSFAVPSLGLKADAISGRLNALAFVINRPGVFHGQCSELCGALHSAMPIGVQAVTLPSFLTYVHSQQA